MSFHILIPSFVLAIMIQKHKKLLENLLIRCKIQILRKDLSNVSGFFVLRNNSLITPIIHTGAIYRYKKSCYNDSRPGRILKAAENKVKTRKSQERKRVCKYTVLSLYVFICNPMHMQLFDRRGKMVYESEHDCWKHLTKECMSDESDNDDGTKTRHTPKWQSDSKLLLVPLPSSPHHKTHYENLVSPHSF